jgi:hypothetical protein
LKITWKYRCSLCGRLVHPDDVSKHTAEEREKPTWPGHMSWLRVEDEEPR